MRLFRPIERWRRLPRRAQTTTLSMAALVPIISVCLHTVGFSRTVAWLTSRAGTTGDSGQPRELALRECVSAIGRVRHYAPWAGRCLAQSLALWWMLKHRGVQAELRLGVRLVDGRLEAHAWLEREGSPLNEGVSVGTRFPGSFSLDLRS